MISVFERARTTLLLGINFALQKKNGYSNTENRNSSINSRSNQGMDWNTKWPRFAGFGGWHKASFVWIYIGWQTLKLFLIFSSLKNDNASKQDVVRVVCVSDTHNQTSRMDHVVPDGDILIHAGDFSITGLVSEVKQFNDWLGTLPHKHKIVIAG